MASKRKGTSKPQRRDTKIVAPKRSSPLGSGAGIFLRRNWKWVLAAIVALHVLLSLLTLTPAPHTGGDNAGYLALAKSLLQDQQYREIYDPTAPAHTKYPPVYPMVLAIALALGLKPWLQIKLITVAFSALAVVFSYLWVRRHGRPELATAVALLLAVSPGVLDQSHWELSDVPFWALTMIALWAWERVPNALRGRFLVAVAFTTLAYFTRSAGLPLLLAAGAWLTWQKRWRQLAVFAAVIVPLAFLWWLRARGHGVEYVSQFWGIDPYDPSKGTIGVGDLFSRIADNGGRYLGRHLPILLFGVEGLVIMSVGITALAFYGWLMRVRNAGVGELFTPFYIGLILVWPAVWSGERFLLPAFSCLLFYAGDGVVRLARLAARPAARLVPAAAAALIVLIGMPATGRAVRVGMECSSLYRAGDRYSCLHDGYKEYYRIAEIAHRLLPENAAVVTRKPRSFYVIGGVPGIEIPLTDNADEFFRRVTDTHTGYVVFDRLDVLARNYLAPILMQRTDAFCVMFSLGPDRTSVFGIKLAAAAHPPAAQAVSGEFAPCPDTYWRSPAVRDSLLQGLIPLY